MEENNVLTNVGFVFQIVIVILLIIGVLYFKRKKTRMHGLLTATATILNTISIVTTMVPALLSETEYIVEDIHGIEAVLLLGHHIIGLVAETLAVFIVLRWAFNNFKPEWCRGRIIMNLTFYTWLISLISGIAIYIMHFIE